MSLQGVTCKLRPLAYGPNVLNGDFKQVLVKLGIT